MVISVNFTEKEFKLLSEALNLGSIHTEDPVKSTQFDLLERQLKALSYFKTHKNLEDDN